MQGSLGELQAATTELSLRVDELAAEVAQGQMEVRAEIQRMSAAVTAALCADRYAGSAGSPHEASKHVSKVAHKASAGSRKHGVHGPAQAMRQAMPHAMPQAMPQAMRPAALPNQSINQSLPSAVALPSPPRPAAEGAASACHADGRPACRASSRGGCIGGSLCVDSTGHAGHVPPTLEPPFLPHMNADGWAMRYAAPAPTSAETTASALLTQGSSPLLASATGKVRRNALTTRPHHRM